jgi:hypothetical protein
MTWSRTLAAGVSALGLAAGSACGGSGAGRGDAPAEARFTREIAWAGRGTWIKVDTHMHTTFSDGAHGAAEVVARAIEHGCRAIAITDHADRNLKAATAEYEATIQGLRTAHPEIVILAGLEWNVPPWDGDEHAVVLVPPGPNEWKTLAEFKERFDDFRRGPADKVLVEEALKWLAENGGDRTLPPVVVYDHPSRKDMKSIENVADIERWHAVNDVVVSFEGGPGHQGKTPLGSYDYKEELIDRWDPVVARVGDAWDTLLQKGIDIGGALATSDFHNADRGGLSDFWPGQFSETWLYVPEVSADGVLRALRAGALAGVHGHIARNVEITVEAGGLDRPAVAGEAIEVSSGSSVTVTVSADLPDRDWQRQPNKLDAVELIGITKEKAEIVANRPPLAGRQIFREVVAVPPGGIVVRARGRRTIADGPDLMFYTNPIRVNVR